MNQLFLAAFDAIAVTFEMFIVHMYLNAFLEKKSYKKVCLLIYLVFGGILVAASLFSLNMYILLTITLLGVLSVSFAIYYGSTLARLFSALLFCVIVVAAEIATAGILAALTSTHILSVLEYGELRIIGSILANLLCLLCIKVIGVFIKKKSQPASKLLREMMPLLGFLICTIYLLVTGFSATLASKEQFSIISVIEILAIVYMSIMVFWYYDRIMRIHELKHEKEVMEINAASQVKYYDLVKKQYDILAPILHDIKKHEKVMEGLAVASEYSQAAEYLDYYKSTLEATSMIVSTPNHVVSLILSECVMQALLIGIDPVIEVYLDKDLSMDAADITVILGNTIENALRALSDMPTGSDKILNILLRQRNGFLIYEIRNSYLPQEKSAARNGYGLRIIKECIKKYNGELSFSKDACEYSVTVILQLHS